MRNPTFAKPPRGYSLIECLVLITAVSILVGVTAILIRALIDLERVDRQRVVASETVERLGRTLRADARACSIAPKVEAGGTSMKLDDGTTVDYLVEEKRVVRTLHRVDKSKHHDVFVLPPRVAAMFESRGEAPNARRLVVVLNEQESAGRPAIGAYRSFAIEAALGRDLRYRGDVK